MPRAIVVQDGEHGTAELVETDTELKTLQQIVNGYIEAVDLGDVVLAMDEEGKLKGKDLNRRATQFLYKVAPQYEFVDVLVGTVVIFGDRPGGDLADVPQFAIEHFDL